MAKCAWTEYKGCLGKELAAVCDLSPKTPEAKEVVPPLAPKKPAAKENEVPTMAPKEPSVNGSNATGKPTPAPMRAELGKPGIEEGEEEKGAEDEIKVNETTPTPKTPTSPPASERSHSPATARSFRTPALLLLAFFALPQ
jgi:hypothetical protein